MHRFFVPADQIPVISGQDAHHLKNVLRAKIDDKVELLDGNGNIYLANILEIKKDNVICKILSSSPEISEAKVKVTLAQALPKSSKMELIIQKTVELGVNQIIPVISERSVVRQAKTSRWQKIAKKAAEQSKRGLIPKILEPMKIEDVLKSAKEYDLAIISWELENEKSLKNLLKDFLISQSPNLQIPQFPNILLLIGPEGGFSHKEIESAKASAFVPVSLGKRILRTETAAIATLSAIMYELD